MSAVMLEFVHLNEPLHKLLCFTCLLSWTTFCLNRNVGLKFFAIRLRWCTDVVSSPIGYLAACLCSSYLLSHTHILRGTPWKHVDRNNFAQNENFWILHPELVICYKIRRTCCAQLRKVRGMISRTRAPSFIGLDDFRKLHIVFQNSECCQS
jgi:hypothetical protein